MSDSAGCYAAIAARPDGLGPRDKLIAATETQDRSANTAQTTGQSLVINESELANSTQYRLGAINGHCGLASNNSRANDDISVSVLRASARQAENAKREVRVRRLDRGACDVDAVGEIARDLRHELAVRVRCDSRYMHCACAACETLRQTTRTQLRQPPAAPCPRCPFPQKPRVAAP